MDEPFGCLRTKEKQKLEMLQRESLTSSMEKGRWSKIRYSTEDCGDEGKQKVGKKWLFCFLMRDRRS